MRSQCQPTSSWNGLRNANGASQVAERGPGLWCPGPPTCTRGAAQLSGELLWARSRSSGATLSPACSGPSDRTALSPVLLEQGQVLGSKQAELALGGVKKKEFFLEVYQGFTKTLEGCLT